MTSDSNANAAAHENAAAGANASAPGIVDGPETTSAGGGDGATKRTPVYKRRRRCNYAIVAAVIVVVAGLSAWLATSGGGGATPDFTITTSQGAVANSDSIIESDPSLAKTIPAKLHFIPFDAVAWQHPASICTLTWTFLSVRDSRDKTRQLVRVAGLRAD